MDECTRKTLLDFYKQELCENILRFWMPVCEDKTYGGFLNCFTNRGDKLVSHDKYIWSQGRFVWMFSKLSQMKMFSDSERAEFLRLASQGAEFLYRHALIEGWALHCTFLTDETGKAKMMDGSSRLDMSIYADCFVIAGMGRYAAVSGDFKCYAFARELYRIAFGRYHVNNFQTLPYPLSPEYRAHGLPMIFQNVARELYDAAIQFEPAFAETLVRDADEFSRDILDHFTDDRNLIHEVIRSDNTFFPDLLGQHINPGHSIEDIWFHLDTARLANAPERTERLAKIALATFEAGWDKEYGGILHFASLDGGEPVGDPGATADEPMTKQTQTGWGDKLWWVHSEALYTSLRLYVETDDERFMDWHKRVKEYTFATFPNPDKAIGEWIQIRTRDGSPQDKVVALPVKDPYHITRNLTLIIDLLENTKC